MQTSSSTSLEETKEDWYPKWHIRDKYLVLDRPKNSNNEVLEAEVLESTVIDEGYLKVLLKAGRVIAQPALEAFELIIDSSTPPQVRVSIIGALTYLIVPVDLIPDFIPASGFSDDLVALTAVISLWRHHITPEIKFRAKCKLDKWFPKMNKERWSKTIEEDLILLIKDWLRQTGKTQSELCQSLNLPSARMPTLIDFLKKDFVSGGIPKIASRLCEIEALWTKGEGNTSKKMNIELKNSDN